MNLTICVRRKRVAKQYNMISKSHMFTYLKLRNENDHRDAVLEG